MKDQVIKKEKNIIENNNIFNFDNSKIQNLETLQNNKIFKEEKRCISFLLPYDPKTKSKGDLQKSLYEYLMLIEAFCCALRAFKNGEYEKFDALVGENACQIRAIKIALMAKNNSINYSFLEEKIINIKNLIEEVLIPKNINKWMSTDSSFNDLLYQEKLSLFLSEDELFLLKSYLLTEVKVSNVHDKIFTSFLINEITYINKLKKHGDVSYSFLKKLVKNIRFLLSHKSVEFIKNNCNKFNNLSFISQLDDFIIKYRELLCVPIFCSVKTILHMMLENKITLIIHAKFVKRMENNKITIFDEDHIVYISKKDNNGNYTFIEVPYNSLEKNNPVIIFEGIVLNNTNNTTKFKKLWKLCFSSSSITKIILANAAAHRQYPNLSLDVLMDKYNDKEYQQYKTFAEEKGFSKNNPKSFLIRHIYTSKIVDVF